VLADRLDRRLTVAITASSEAAFVALFVLAIVHGVTATAPYFAILVLIGVARAFGTPAERALLPTIVASDRFIRAQATYSTFRQFTVIGGPALGGVLVAISRSAVASRCSR
jgi:MFS-type transporter involved in bile tolerance (Atg22 family)